MPNKSLYNKRERVREEKTISFDFMKGKDCCIVARKREKEVIGVF